MTGTRLLDTALEPVRTALRVAAARDADALRQDADAAAEQDLVSARAEAESLREQARRLGLADAAAELTARRTRARRAEHSRILSARRAAYDALREAALRGAADLCEGADYPLLRRCLVESARRDLGPAAVVRDEPGGGVVAEAGTRRVDLSFASLVDRAVETVAAEEEP